MIEPVKVMIGDCIESMRTLPDGSVDCCITSPPYWGLRNYGHEAQLGMEQTPDEYVSNMVHVFSEVKRVLRDNGTLWLNLGDTYSSGGRITQVRDTMRDAASGKQDYLNGTAVRAATPPGMKPKDLVGIPWMVAFSLRADGWYLRQDIIWAKGNPMPESVRDRCTRSHEYIFMFSKKERYYYDADAIKEPAKTWTGSAATFDRNNGKALLNIPPGQAHAQHRPGRDKQRLVGNPTYAGSNDRYKNSEPSPTRNRRSVWQVNTRPYKGAHFATFPPDLIRPCVRAGCRPGGTIIDPFAGSGTTGQVAIEEGRNAILCELNQNYEPLIESRIAAVTSEITRTKKVSNTERSRAPCTPKEQLALDL